MIVHVVGGGPEAFLCDLTSYNTDKNIIWIGVDRGTRYLLNSGITPNYAIGDFDSVTKQELSEYEKHLPIELHRSEKDETDMELGLRHAANLQPELIRVFGATGGRADHMLANIFLLSKLFSNFDAISIEMIDRQNRIEVKQAGTYKIYKDRDKKYVSFIPLSEKVEALTLIGFKYPLEDRNISLGSTLCISNELIQDYGTYSFASGILLIVRSSDELNRA